MKNPTNLSRETVEAVVDALWMELGYMADERYQEYEKARAAGDHDRSMYFCELWNELSKASSTLRVLADRATAHMFPDT